MRPLTASSFERTSNCTASIIYTSYAHTGKDAVSGTDKHSEKESEGDSDFDLGLQGAEREVAYVINPRTRSVTRLGTDRKRDYGSRPWYTVACTLDLEHVGDVVTVVDFKSFKRVSSPLKNMQIRLQALATSVHYKKPVKAGLVYLDNGEQDFHEFTTFDHMATWKMIDETIDRIMSSTGYEPAPRSGPWCSYCDCVLQCAAIKSDIKALADGEEDVEKAYNTLKAMGVAYDKGWEKLKNRVKAEPVLLSTGRLLRMKENSKGAWLLKEEKP